MKVFANKALEFTNGTEKAEVKDGFNTVPDWVGETEYFKLALADGSVKTFETPTFTEAEKNMAAEEKKAFEAKIKSLEEENAKLKSNPNKK